MAMGSGLTECEGCTCLGTQFLYPTTMVGMDVCFKQVFELNAQLLQKHKVSVVMFKHRVNKHTFTCHWTSQQIGVSV